MLGFRAVFAKFLSFVAVLRYIIINPLDFLLSAHYFLVRMIITCY